jgi:hypothetical protein
LVISLQYDITIHNEWEKWIFSMYGVHLEVATTTTILPAYEDVDDPYLPAPGRDRAKKRRSMLTNSAIVLATGAASAMIAGGGDYYAVNESADYGHNYQTNTEVRSCTLALEQELNVHSTTHLPVPCQPLASRLPYATGYVNKAPTRVYAWSNVDSFVGQASIQPAELQAQKDEAMQRALEVGEIAALVGVIGCTAALYFSERRRDQEAY